MNRWHWGLVALGILAIGEFAVAQKYDSNGNLQTIVNNTPGPLVDGTSVSISVTGAATTLLAGAVAGQIPRILAYHLESNNSGGTYQFVQGTQATNPCDTTQSPLTGAIPADNSAHAGSTQGDGTGTLIKATAINRQICLVTTGAGVGFTGFATYWSGP